MNSSIRLSACMTNSDLDACAMIKQSGCTRRSSFVIRELVLELSTDSMTRSFVCSLCLAAFQQHAYPTLQTPDPLRFSIPPDRRGCGLEKDDSSDGDHVRTEIQRLCDMRVSLLFVEESVNERVVSDLEQVKNLFLSTSFFDLLLVYLTGWYIVCTFNWVSSRECNFTCTALFTYA